MPSFLKPGLRKIKKSAADVFSRPVRRFLEGKIVMLLPPVGEGASPCGGLNANGPHRLLCLNCTIWKGCRGAALLEEVCPVIGGGLCGSKAHVSETVSKHSVKGFLGASS